LTWQITHQAGAGVIRRVSAHFLVAAHVFLELLPYLVWVMVIPLMTLRISLKWIHEVSLAELETNSHGFRGGWCLWLILWASFLTDYATTCNVSMHDSASGMRFVIFDWLASAAIERSGF